MLIKTSFQFTDLLLLFFIKLQLNRIHFNALEVGLYLGWKEWTVYMNLQLGVGRGLLLGELISGN